MVHQNCYASLDVSQKFSLTMVTLMGEIGEVMTCQEVSEYLGILGTIPGVVLVGIYNQHVFRVSILHGWYYS